MRFHNHIAQGKFVGNSVVRIFSCTEISSVQDIKQPYKIQYNGNHKMSRRYNMDIFPASIKTLQQFLHTAAVSWGHFTYSRTLKQ